MKKSFGLLLGIFTLVWTSCQKPKSTTPVATSESTLSDSLTVDPVKVADVAPQAPVEETKKVDWINLPETDFESLKIRSKVEFVSANLSQDFPVNFQIRKDSLIWVSVSVGLEVGRGIITQDSIILVDRINKNVYRLDFPSLSQKIGFPLNFALVQSLVIGDLLLPQREQDEVVRDSIQVKIRQQESGLILESLIDLAKNKVVQVNGSRLEASEKLELSYPTFLETVKGLFPNQVFVKIDNQEKPETPTRIKLDHQKVEFVSRDLRFPFNVPRNYTEKTLKP